MASPCKGALDLVNQILRYHATNPDLGIGVPLVDPKPPQGANAIAIYCDSDNSCNPEVQNKRRGQFSNIIGYRSSQEAVDAIGGIVPTIAPVMMASKTLGIAFATPLIGKSHAACGSGENEVYALGNTINDILEFTTSKKRWAGR